MTERERLQQSLAFVRSLSDEHWWLFANACRLMDDHCWVGPTARAFAADQSRQNRSLQAALQEAETLIRQKLHRTP